MPAGNSCTLESDTELRRLANIMTYANTVRSSATMSRYVVSIMGKRMFELGERMWPAEAPFHTPVFVTHTVRARWQRPEGTTFHFIKTASSRRQAARAR